MRWLVRTRGLELRLDGAGWAGIPPAERLWDDFETAITQLGTDASKVSSRIRSRLLVLTVIVHVILIWIDVAQVCIAVVGWRLLRS
jgi:hypothetical protein